MALLISLQGLLSVICAQAQETHTLVLLSAGIVEHTLRVLKGNWPLLPSVASRAERGSRNSSLGLAQQENIAVVNRNRSEVVRDALTLISALAQSTVADVPFETVRWCCICIYIGLFLWQADSYCVEQFYVQACECVRAACVIAFDTESRYTFSYQVTHKEGPVSVLASCSRSVAFLCCFRTSTCLSRLVVSIDMHFIICGAALLPVQVTHMLWSDRSPGTFLPALLSECSVSSLAAILSRSARIEMSDALTAMLAYARSPVHAPMFIPSRPQDAATGDVSVIRTASSGGRCTECSIVLSFVGVISLT